MGWLSEGFEGSAEAQHSESDLAEDAVTSQSFGENSDHEAEHGNAAVQQFCAHQSLTFDLARSCILIPLVLGGCGRTHSLDACEGILRAFVTECNAFDGGVARLSVGQGISARLIGQLRLEMNQSRHFSVASQDVRFCRTS